MNDVVIYTQCQIFEVRVTVGTGGSLSPIEQHVLNAIDAGIDTVTGLCDVLGLSSRLMVDLLGDLWRSGHVGFDFGNERVWLTGPVRKLVAEDALDTLPGAEISDETQLMMLDTLSGQVTSVGGAQRPLARNREIPPHAGEAQLGDVDQAALIEAITRTLNENRQLAGAHPMGGRLKRVVRAYLSPASLTSPSAERRYRAVGIKAALDADGQLMARLAEDAVPGRYRDNAQARLTRLIEDQPNSSFVQALRSAAGGPPQEPATLASTLAEFGDRALALDAVPVARRQKEQDGISAASRRIVTRLHGLAEQVSQVSLLTGHAAHEAAIKELIRGADTQVVLACPWLGYQGLLTYAPLLEEAARRGVQIVLLWGIGRGDTPEDEVRNALSALRRQASARVVISPETSSIIHAKLVVSDARQAIVTSLNFLDPSKLGAHEVGILVQAMPGLPSPAIFDALTWACDAMPDYAVAQSIINDSESLPVAPGEAEPEPLADTGEDPPLTALALDDAPGGPAVSAWASAWRQRAGELAVAARRQRPSVRLIRDGEHKDILWTALRTARHHLLITSDGLAEDVVDKAFVEHVEQCLDRGVDMTLVYRTPRREAGAQAAQRLKELSGRHQTGPGRLRLVRRNNHAKVLVMDDEAVVTSFNFLSFEGYYGGVGRRRQRSEVGVRIYGGGIARQLLESFGVGPDGSPPPGDRELTAQAGQTRVQLRAFSVAQQLLDRMARQNEQLTGQQLAGLAGPGAEGLAVLDALRGCGADPGVLEPVVAAVLGRDDSAADGDGTRRDADDWWAWLARRRFEEQDFTVAAALRAAVSGPDARPRPALASVAACRGTAELSAAVSDAALREDLGQDEWNIIVVIAACELLRTGRMETDLAGVLRIALPAVSGAWADLGMITLRWWEAALQPLPVDQLRRGEEQRQKVAGEVGSWANLDRQLGAFERYSPPFTAGSATQRFLLRAGGPLNLLKLAADNQDRAAVRTWLADAKLKNVGGWVDAATKAAGVSTLIEGHLRPPFVGRVTDIVAAARAVAEHDDTVPTPPETADETAEAARVFMREFTAVLPRLQAAATAVDLPERVLAEAAVRDLEQLAAGGAP